jgi:plastocyanin
MSASEATNVVGNADARQMRSQEIEIRIDYFSFIPHDITVARGATVTWVNLDDAEHTVTSTDKSFKSKILGTDDRFSFVFNKAGTFEYYCSIHPKMTAKIIVR